MQTLTRQELKAIGYLATLDNYCVKSVLGEVTLYHWEKKYYMCNYCGWEWVEVIKGNIA